jgi:hypothetical protein
MLIKFVYFDKTIHMKKLLPAILLAFTFSGSLVAQCTFNNAQFGSGAAPGVQGQTTVVSTCNYLYEFSPVSGFFTSTVYTVDINVPGYVTILDAGLNVVAFGSTPFQFTPPADGLYNIQWNGPGCAEDFSCYTTSVTNFGPAAPCTNPVLAGTTQSSVLTACPGQPFTLSLSGASSGSGITYQWQSSTDGVTFTNISGATGTTYIANQSALTYYRCEVICSGGVAANSTSLMVDMGACVIMGNGVQTACNGTFYDSGGGAANYMNAENYTLTITPSTPGTLLQVDFNSFQLETCCDNLTIYNGNSIAAPLMGSFTTNPGSITSSAIDGSLTFVFYSDFSVVYSGWEASLTCITPPTNDLVCDAITLAVDGSVNNYNNGGAGLEPGESAIAPPATGANTTDGWDNSTMTFTTWFKFTAPTSGNVTINCSDIEFDGQVAVYEVGTCSDFNTFNLVAANDDAMDNSSTAPKFTVCGLTPGTTYYLVHDSRSTFSTGAFSLQISPLTVEAGTFDAVLDVCSGDSVDLFNGIAGNDLGGTWYEQVPTVGLNGSVFNSTGIAYQVFEFDYVVVDGCASDTNYAQVHIFGPSLAGEDGTLEICRNTAFNLLEGLAGTVDLGGTWYDPSNQPIAGNTVSGLNIPGQYNYDYITSNGVCPNDTANVLVTIVDCPLGIGENGLSNLSIYPNPTNGLIYLSNLGGQLQVDFDIIDAQGRVIPCGINTVDADAKVAIDLTIHEAGIYGIRFQNQTGTHVYRFVKVD